MNARRFVRIGIVAILAAAGCKAHPDSSSTANVRPSSVVVAPQAPTTKPSADVQPADSVSPLPETLAQKTAAYARSLEPTAGNRPSRQVDPSSVQWDDPKRGVERSSTPPAAANSVAHLPPSTPPAPKTSTDVHPGASPTASATDTTHATAIARSAKSNALNDVPAIVPESSDFPGSSPSSANDSLEQRLARRIRDNPRDIAGHLDYELYGLLRDEASPQLASISSLPNEDRELVAAVVDGVSNFRTGVRQDNNMLLSKKIRPLLDMSDRLRNQAELAVPTVALCKHIDGFGKYDPIVPSRFPAGRDNPVIVYCEVQNFESHLNDKRMWETQLTQQVTLFTDTGMLAWQDKSRPVSDECRNRRHDFFLYDLVKLPGNLTIGRYLLKVSIEDRTAHRVAEATVLVEMVGQ